MQLSAKKTILILLLTIGILFILSGYAFWRVESRNLINLHTAREIDATRSFQNYLKISHEPQRLLTYDYSYWDEMVDFVASRDSAWSKENLEATFATFDVDAVWVLNKEFETIYAIWQDSSGIVLPIEIPTEVITSVKQNWFNHFFVFTPQGLMEISTAPIQPSNDDPRTSTPFGYFISGRIWDGNRLGILAELTKCEVTISPESEKHPHSYAEGKHLNNIKIGQILFKIDVNNAEKEPISCFTITEIEGVFSESYIYLKRELYVYVIFIIAIISLIYLTTITLIYNPLSKIITSLEKEDPAYVASLQSQSHEFGKLARLVTDSFRHRMELSKEIAKQKEAEAALRSSEMKYRALFENSRDAIYLRTIEGNLIDFNQAMVEMFGYSRDDMIGMEIDFLYETHPDEASLLQHKDLFGGVKDFEVKLRKADGNPIDCLVSSSKLLDSAGAIIGVQGIIRDITARKQLEEQYRQAQKMDSIGRLAGGVAHDFNNMLQAVLGNLELALDQVESDSILSRNILDAQNAAQRSADLTRQLLAFARKQMISPKALDLNEVVGGMLKMLRRLLGENISLAWSPGHKLWKVKVDPSQIDQILANLCVNARDAIPDVGEVEVVTRNITFDQQYCDDHIGSIPGEYVLLSVKDNGCGMSNEVRERIFEPFFTTKDVGKGTGLGLATVYGIIKQNNGYIDVHSEPGKGTVFNIYFARSSESNLDDETVTEAPIRRSKGETVLMVEDEVDILNVGESMLKWLGYKVLTTNLPEQAIQIVRNHPGEIDLLITDVIMPIMNGRVLSENVRNIRPQIKCLYISGHTADIMGENGIIEDGTHFLQKPFTMKSLSLRIRSALEES